MQIGIYIHVDVDKDGDNRMRCNVGNMKNHITSHPVVTILINIT